MKKIVKKTTKKIQKKPKEFKVTKKKAVVPKKILTAEGYRRALLNKVKK